MAIKPGSACSRWLLAILALLLSSGVLALVGGSTAQAAAPDQRTVAAPFGVYAYQSPTADSPTVRYYYKGELTGVIQATVPGQAFEGRTEWVRLPVNNEGLTAYIWAGALSQRGPPIPAGTTPSKWALLRQCESGGNYAINTGNGYYGAYQFDKLTWQGLGYKGLPHEADPATQDEAAYRLYSSGRGWTPWPACSKKWALSSN